MNKPKVSYTSIIYLRKGDSAIVTPVDHPSPLVSNQKAAWTSPVLAINQDGSFETENTLYIPSGDKTRAEAQSYFNQGQQ